MVLTWNGRPETTECLASLARVAWKPLSLIVVDNDSSDGTPDSIRRAYPDVHLIVNDSNLGFSEGNNVGIRYATTLGADYVLVLNNDTTVAAGAVAEMVRTAEGLPDCGAVCPTIYFADPPDLIWYAGATFDPNRSHSGRMTGYRELDNRQRVGIQRVSRAVGAAMLIPRRSLEKVGHFDERLFLYYEDVDWSLRANSVGLHVYLAPEAQVWHSVSAAAGGEESLVSAYYGTRNHLTVVERWAPLGLTGTLRRRFGVLAVHAAAARRTNSPFAYLRAVGSGWWDGVRNRLGRRSSL